MSLLKIEGLVMDTVLPEQAAEFTRVQHLGAFVQGLVKSSITVYKPAEL